MGWYLLGRPMRDGWFETMLVPGINHPQRTLFSLMHMEYFHYGNVDLNPKQYSLGYSDISYSKLYLQYPRQSLAPTSICHCYIFRDLNKFVSRFYIPGHWGKPDPTKADMKRNSRSSQEDTGCLSCWWGGDNLQLSDMIFLIHCSRRLNAVKYLEEQVKNQGAMYLQSKSLSTSACYFGTTPYAAFATRLHIHTNMWT